jgi:hypothetical protein
MSDSWRGNLHQFGTLPFKQARRSIITLIKIYLKRMPQTLFYFITLNKHFRGVKNIFYKKSLIFFDSGDGFTKKGFGFHIKKPNEFLDF